MPSNAQQIYNLTKPYVKDGLILPRTLAFFNQHMDEFELCKKGSTIIACAGLRGAIYGITFYARYSSATRAFT